ncbi:hypothetical protein VTK56DRAFT_4291 [Thermocarpiscus australiensis]
MWANHPREISVIPRCGICGFELLLGDRVVIVEEDGRRESDYPFVPAESTKDRLPGVQYNGRILEEWNIDGLDVGCHVECLASEPCTPPRARFQAMAYGYFPRPAEVERRERWLRPRLGLTLHRILGQRFSIPLELCLQIAAYCRLREYAAAASRAFWEKYSATPTPRQHRFGISSEVWARHVEFEGVRYIAHLTNEPGDQLASFSLVYTPTPGKGADTLYVAEDYLGIRDIFFVSSPAMPPVHYDPGVWWKRLEIPPGYFFEAWTDLTKLRSLLVLDPEDPKFTFETGASHLMPAWEQPQLATEQAWWHRIFSPAPGVMRMTSLVCNAPGTTAYSVCCDNRPYTIRAHTAGERDLAFYSAEEMPDRHAAVWLYAPIAGNERVAEIWVRRWETYMYIYHAAFILRTDQDRTLVLGPDPVDPGFGHDAYTLVYRAGEKPGRIHFDISPEGIHELALEAPLPPQPAAGQPPLPQPESPCPRHCEEDENYFYSAAVLDGVAAVTPCRAAERGIIVGLLLHYHDGRQASLGQVRLDRLQQPALRVVDPPGRMWLRFALAPDGCPNVDAITFDPQRAGPEHFPVAWRGTLEWWFSHRQCRLWHDQRSTPPTVRGLNLTWSR